MPARAVASIAYYLINPLRRSKQIWQAWARRDCRDSVHNVAAMSYSRAHSFEGSDEWACAAPRVAFRSCLGGLP
jgi:hypothetical protein